MEKNGNCIINLQAISLTKYADAIIAVKFLLDYILRRMSQISNSDLERPFKFFH
jgi:hypothetical protein